MLLLENIIIVASVILFISLYFFCMRSERWQRARIRFKRDRLGSLCFLIICLYALIGLMDSIQLSSQTTLLDYCFRKVPQEKSYSAPFAHTTYSVNNPEPLKGRHWVGTDFFGKDVLLQSMKACRTAVIIGGLTSLIYIPLGVLFGIAAGYYKRWIDDLIQYIYSTLASIPGILLLIATIMVLDNLNIKIWGDEPLRIPRLVQISLALGVTSWVGLCRLIRGETLRQVERPYAEAAKVLGQRNIQIMFHHILPNIMHLVIINFILGFSGLVLTESILSYIGIGAPIGTASWGLMINSARMELAREPTVWWNITAATIALFLLVLSLNLLGDSLRRAFNPRAR